MKLDPGISVFVGENGQGKTNLLEAVGYLSTFSSHRVGNDGALIRQGKSAGVIRAKTVSGQTQKIIELEIVAGKANRARINRGNVNVGSLRGIIKTVLFAPEDLSLVKGDPKERRKFLDLLIIQLKPGYAAVCGEYEKVLRQRAALLKNAGKMRRRGLSFDEKTLDVWDLQLARLGARMIFARAEATAALRRYIQTFYRELSGTEQDVRITYEASLYRQRGGDSAGEETLPGSPEEENGLPDTARTEREMLETLRLFHEREILRGVNLVGPHRDDLCLFLGTLPVKGYASHGESWSYALALKLASWKVLQENEDNIWDENTQPILLLDDVFAELDAGRRIRLAEIVSGAQQVLITAAVGDDLPASLEGNRFFVTKGAVEKIDVG